MNITEPGLAPTRNKKRTLLLLVTLVLLSAMLHMGMDKIESGFSGTGYYFSESLMFSSFWWLFVPFLYVQFRAVQSKMPALQYFTLLVVPVILHLVSFPAFVRAIVMLMFSS